MLNTVPTVVCVAIAAISFGIFIAYLRKVEKKMLTLNNVSKNFGKFTAVENISLNMDNGLYALLAPNGAGKTTIIKMITTLLNPTEVKFYMME